MQYFVFLGGRSVDNKSDGLRAAFYTPNRQFWAFLFLHFCLTTVKFTHRYNEGEQFERPFREVRNDIVRDAVYMGLGYNLLVI